MPPWVRTGPWAANSKFFFGALTHSFIKAHLFNPATVCLGLFAGGTVMIGIEKVLTNDNIGPP